MNAEKIESNPAATKKKNVPNDMNDRIFTYKVIIKVKQK